MSRFLRPLCSTLALTLVATTAGAQSAQIQATATVSTALAATAVQNLAFGAVFPGVNRTILVTDAASGRFKLTGALGAGVKFTLQVPSSLVGPGTTPPTLAIGTWTGCHSVTNTPGTCSTFVVTAPSTVDVPATLNATNGDLYVFLGASLTVPNPQAAGAYTANITLTAAYTGT